MIILTPMSQQGSKDFNSKNYFCIPSFYDSHLHFEGIGKYLTQSNLNYVSSLTELNSLVTKLKVTTDRSKTSLFNDNSKVLGTETLVLSDNIITEGFGLRTFLTQNLTQLYSCFERKNPIHNFYFVLEDGHQVLVCGPMLKEFLKKTGIKEDFVIYKDLALFTDLNRKYFDTFYTEFKNVNSESKSLLKSSETNSKKYLLQKAQNQVLKSGITHFRDMTSDLKQLDALLEIEKNKQLFVFPELFFSNFHGEKIDSIISDCKDAQAICKNLQSRIKQKGIKIFLDGTFSQNTVDSIATSNWKKCGCDHVNLNEAEQLDTSNATQKSYQNTDAGLNSETLTLEDIKSLLVSASQADLEVAFHVIGDLAIEKVVEAFIDVKSKFITQLHLEHCELINNHTLTSLANLRPSDKAKITFHFQPSHYLMDKDLLEKFQKKFTDLNILDWSTLKIMGFKVFFGSDAPVTKLGLNYLHELNREPHFITQYGKTPFWAYFNHPDYRKTPNTFTLFNNYEVKSVIVEGQKII